MTNYGQFHDGFLDGLWVNDKTAHLFLATEDREHFVMVAEGVAALIVNEFRTGNILFEVLIRNPEEATLQDVQTLYPLRTGSAGELQGANLLEKIRSEKWNVLEIIPSYGASCLVLANSYRLLKLKQWREMFGFGGVKQELD